MLVAPCCKTGGGNWDPGGVLLQVLSWNPGSGLVHLNQTRGNLIQLELAHEKSFDILIIGMQCNAVHLPSLGFGSTCGLPCPGHSMNA